MAIIGIDLGTTYSLACVWKNGRSELIPNALGEVMTPSVIGLDDNGDVLTGQIARERLISHPERTAASFKRYMGTDKVLQLGGRGFRPEELSALVLRSLKRDAEAYLDEPVSEAVISVPAYFHDSQRVATKLAGKLAGLRVDRLINEPSAAALAYQQHLGRDGTFLVFDFGGGTLDVSVVECFENITDILAVSGDNHLGGDDIDRAIERAFLDRHKGLEAALPPHARAQVRSQAERCKIALSYALGASMSLAIDGASYEMTLTRKELLELAAPLFARVREVVHRALADAGRRVDALDEVILVGGSSKMPVVQDFVRHLTGKEPLCSIEPNTTVAVGAGMVAGIKVRDESIRDMVLTDICPFTLGVEAGMPPSVTPIIERNTALPASRRNLFSNMHDNQRRVEVRVYQGESIKPEDNLLLGTLAVDIPRAKAGEILFTICLSYDLNGILEVEVEGKELGKNSSKLLLRSGLSESEAAERQRALQALKIPPREQEENRLLTARAERLYAESAGFQRQELRQRLYLFQAALEKGSPAGIKKEQMAFARFLESFAEAETGLREDEYDLE